MLIMCVHMCIREILKLCMYSTITYIVDQNLGLLLDQAHFKNNFCSFSHLLSQKKCGW